MYSHLFSPIEIGGKTVKNRITMAPLYVGQANEDGTVSKATIDHYTARAAAGTGMIVVEAASVSPNSDGVSGYDLKVYDDRFLPGMTELAHAIKSNGAVAVQQINHTGRYSGLRPPLSASAVTFQPAPGAEVTPKEMTKDEIREAIDEYASAAARVKQAGFDMVEIHGATGYLVVQFLSPIMNVRTDEYGGSLENRLRFPREILKAIKEKTGGDFPVGIRFLADDFIEGGFSPDESSELAKKLEEDGIAYFSLTGGIYDSFFLPDVQAKLAEKGNMSYLSENVKKAVKVPVLLGNTMTNPEGDRVSRPDIADGLINDGKADGVALGRPLLRDPEYVRKLEQGRAGEISACQCCMGCMGLVMQGKRVFCVRVAAENA